MFNISGSICPVYILRVHRLVVVLFALLVLLVWVMLVALSIYIYIYVCTHVSYSFFKLST